MRMMMIATIPSLLIRGIGVKTTGSLHRVALSTGSKVWRANLLHLHKPHFAVIKQPFSSFHHHHRCFSTTSNNNDNIKNNESKTNDTITPKDQTIETPTTPETRTQSSTLENKTQDTYSNPSNQDQTNNNNNINEKTDPSNDTQNIQTTPTNDQTAQPPTNINNAESETKGEQQIQGNLSTTTNTDTTSTTTDSNSNDNNNNNNNSDSSNNTEQTEEGGWFKSLPLYKKILYSSIFLSLASVIGFLVHQSNLRNSFPYKLVVPLIQNDAEIQSMVGEDIREPKWYQSTLWGYVGDGLGTIDATAKLNIPLVGDNGRKIYVRSTFRKSGTALSQWMIEYLEVTIGNNHEKRILFIDQRKSNIEQ